MTILKQIAIRVLGALALCAVLAVLFAAIYFWMGFVAGLGLSFEASTAIMIGVPIFLLGLAAPWGK